MIRPQAKMDRRRYAEAQLPLNFHRRDQQPAGARRIAIRVRQARQIQHRHTEHLQAGIAVGNAVPFLIIAHAHGLDLPHRRLRAAFSVHHRAGGIDGVFQIIAVAAAGGGARAQPAAIVQYQQHVGNRPVTQAVGQGHPVTHGLIAGRIGDRNIANGYNLAGRAFRIALCSALILHPVCRHPIAIARHLHPAAGHDQARVFIVAELIGFEIQRVAGPRQRVAARRRIGIGACRLRISPCRRAEPLRQCRRRQQRQHGRSRQQAGPAVHQGISGQGRSGRHQRRIAVRRRARNHQLGVSAAGS